MRVEMFQKSDENAVLIKLRNEIDGSGIAVVAVDSDGDELSTLCVITGKGVEMVQDVSDDLGFELVRDGELKVFDSDGDEI